MECANSSSEPCSQFIALAPKCSVIPAALLIDGVARRLRVGFQDGQHGIKRLLVLWPVHRSHSHARSVACIGLASRGNAVSPQSVRAQYGGANTDKMFHR